MTIACSPGRRVPNLEEIYVLLTNGPLWSRYLQVEHLISLSVCLRTLRRWIGSFQVWRNSVQTRLIRFTKHCKRRDLEFSPNVNPMEVKCVSCARYYLTLICVWINVVNLLIISHSSSQQSAGNNRYNALRRKSHHHLVHFCGNSNQALNSITYTRARI